MVRDVKCRDCVYFLRDKIGSGLGIGDCRAGQKNKQKTLLWAGLDRSCNKYKKNIADCLLILSDCNVLPVLYNHAGA